MDDHQGFHTYCLASKIVQCNISLKKTGMEVSIPWPPRDPDLTSLNSFFWSVVKIRNLAHLKEKSKRLLIYATAFMERSGMSTGNIRMLRCTHGNLLNYVRNYLSYFFFNFVIIIS